MEEGDGIWGTDGRLIWDEIDVIGEVRLFVSNRTPIVSVYLAISLLVLMSSFLVLCFASTTLH
jgi:hypothetical protein